MFQTLRVCQPAEAYSVPLNVVLLFLMLEATT